MRLLRKLWCWVVGHNWAVVWREIRVLESETDFEIEKRQLRPSVVETTVLEKVHCLRCGVRDIERERSIRAYLRMRWENPPEIDAGELELRGSSWDERAIRENYPEKRKGCATKREGMNE